jgi:hypothetical protein
MNIAFLDQVISFVGKKGALNRLLTSIARTICVWLSLFLLPAKAATSLPLSTPIYFDKGNIVELSADLARYRNYNIDIVFRFGNDQERAFAKKIVGEPTRSCKISNECGDTVSFVVTIRAGTDVISRQEKTVFGSYAFSATQFYRNIMIIPLRPGHYTITLELVEFTENMTKTNAAIELSTDARASDLEK